MRRIKLIWDFKGEDALQTAKHHQIHLQEFADRENILKSNPGHIQVSDLHTLATMEVNEDIVFKVRDALKPHRAEIIEE